MSYQQLNTIYRAIDTYIHPTDFSLLQCIHGCRVLLDNMAFLHQAKPSREQINVRLRDLQLQATTNNDALGLTEIIDITLNYNVNTIALPVRKAVKSKFSLQTIVADKQNVHISYINNNVKAIATNICTDFPAHKDILNSIKQKLATRPNYNVQVKKTIDFIQSNPTSFGIQCTLKDILSSVFLWILTSKGELRDELLTRLNEELYDANNMCSTGHIARLVNVLQGFTDDPRYILCLDPEKEIKKQIFAKFTRSLKDADENVIDGIVDKTPEYLLFMKNVADKNRIIWLAEFGAEHSEFIEQCISEY